MKDPHSHIRSEPSSADQYNRDNLPDKRDPSEDAPNGGGNVGTNVSPKYSSNTGSRANVATVASLAQGVKRSDFDNSNNTTTVASFVVGSGRVQANKREGDSLFCLVNSRLNINKQNSKHKNKIFPIFPNPNIRNFSNKHIQKPLKDEDGMIKQIPDLIELNKQIFFPLTQLHIYRKESLLTETSTTYLNSVHPKKLRVNLNLKKKPKKLRVNLKKKPKKLRVNLNKHRFKKTNKKLKGLRVASSKTSDVIYEYLKTFSKYSNSQKGVLINFNQHIAYNFNNRNILLR
jgi:hypothetical protein